VLLSLNGTHGEESTESGTDRSSVFNLAGADMGESGDSPAKSNYLQWEATGVSATETTDGAEERGRSLQSNSSTSSMDPAAELAAARAMKAQLLAARTNESLLQNETNQEAAVTAVTVAAGSPKAEEASSTTISENTSTKPSDVVPSLPPSRAGSVIDRTSPNRASSYAAEGENLSAEERAAAEWILSQDRKRESVVSVGSTVDDDLNVPRTNSYANALDNVVAAATKECKECKKGTVVAEGKVDEVDGAFYCTACWADLADEADAETPAGADDATASAGESNAVDSSSSVGVGDHNNRNRTESTSNLDAVGAAKAGFSKVPTAMVRAANEAAAEEERLDREAKDRADAAAAAMRAESKPKVQTDADRERIRATTAAAKSGGIGSSASASNPSSTAPEATDQEQLSTASNYLQWEATAQSLPVTPSTSDVPDARNASAPAFAVLPTLASNNRSTLFIKPHTSALTAPTESTYEVAQPVTDQEIYGNTARGTVYSEGQLNSSLGFIDVS
jgi:hypothetical protein